MSDSSRPSMSKTLEQRYASQKVGGAFDAKAAGTAHVNNLSDEFSDGFTKGGSETNLPKKESVFLKGHSTKKYQG